MKESIIRNRAFQTIIKLITALSFTLFTAYQIYLAVNIETNRVGRLIGIVFYLLLAVLLNHRAAAVQRATVLLSPKAVQAARRAAVLLRQKNLPLASLSFRSL